MEYVCGAIIVGAIGYCLWSIFTAPQHVLDDTADRMYHMGKYAR